MRISVLSISRSIPVILADSLLWVLLMCAYNRSPKTFFCWSLLMLARRVLRDCVGCAAAAIGGCCAIAGFG